MRKGSVIEPDYPPAAFAAAHYALAKAHELRVSQSWATHDPSVVSEFNIGVVGEKEQGEVPGPYPERAANYFDPVKRAKVGYNLGQFFGEANPFGLIPQASFAGVPNPPNIAHDARLPGDQTYSRFSFGDSLSWIRASHSLKFGLSYEMNWAHDGPSSACGDGCFDFGRDPNNPGDANWPFATALLGNFTSYRETNNRPRYNYSFGIQHEIGFNTVLDISYVGNVAKHLLQTVNLNTL
ncbi:MAG: hypothetical protein ACRD2L_24125, partial [Terriglobia bacterium]